MGIGYKCWAASEAEAPRRAVEVWPIAGFSWPATTELPVPAHFEAAAEMVREEDIAKAVVCGPDPARHVEALVEYAGAGFDHVCVHRIGPDQEGFLRFYEREVIPAMRSAHDGRRRRAA